MSKHVSQFIKGKGIYFAILALIGLTGLVVTNEVSIGEELKLVIRDISVTIGTVGSIGLLYELFLRAHFLDEVQKVIIETLQTNKKKMLVEIESFISGMVLSRKQEIFDEIKKEIDSVISEKMPGTVRRITTLGISDAYPKVDFEKLSNWIDQLWDAEIKILKIYMPEPERFRNSLVNAVKYRRCTVKILLLHPDEESTILARTNALAHESYDSYINRIRNSIMDVETMRRQLKEVNKENGLELRLHRSFIGFSLIGIDDEYIVGLYLRNRMATEGTQLKVCKSNCQLFNELREHFSHEWDSLKNVDFDDIDSLKKIMKTKVTRVNFKRKTELSA